MRNGSATKQKRRKNAKKYVKVNAMKKLQDVEFPYREMLGYKKNTAKEMSAIRQKPIGFSSEADNRIYLIRKQACSKTDVFQMRC